MRNVLFDFDESETVLINAITVEGTVTKRCIKGDEETYLIVYWFDGQRREDWLHSWELVGRR